MASRPKAPKLLDLTGAPDAQETARRVQEWALGIQQGMDVLSAQLAAAQAELAVPVVGGVSSVTAGTGITATPTTGAVVVSNSGVTSAVAGSGISVSGPTGAVTVANTGVTSIVAGSGITVSGSTGAVTLSATASVAGSSPLWTPPASAGALDEEFDASGGLPSGWGLYSSAAALTFTTANADPYSTPTVNQGRGNTTWRKSWLTAQVYKNPDDDLAIAKAFAPAANAVYWARCGSMIRYSLTGSSPECCLFGVFADLSGRPDVGNKGLVVGHQVNGSNVTLHARDFAGADNSINVTQGSGRYEYFAIEKIGTAYHAWALADGGPKMYLGTFTLGWTPAWIGFYVRDLASTTPGSMVFAADFLRQTTQLPC